MMRLHSLITLLAAGLLTASCATGNHAVSFSEACNYFFRNDAKQPTDLLIIRSQAELEQYFGEAAFMGKDGGARQKIRWIPDQREGRIER